MTEQYANAVIYLRVSTKEQATKGGEAEGYSIPAQRAACTKKAESIGAQVIDEFIDPGESGTSSNRPKLKEMLTRLAAGDIQYVIVHKIDRLARNRIDDVAINVAIRQAGAKLVSVSENIDETPSGQLMHGIMSSIAEFYSKNLSTEVLKGMSQKVKNGGTPGLAPIGYLNIPVVVENRRNSTIQVDPKRGPIVQWAFQTYATGRVSLTTLSDMLAAQGLVSLHRKDSRPKPLSRSQVHRMLQNKYYIGRVIWNGIEHEGVHTPLVSSALFQKVQEILVGHKVAGDRQRTHDNYLRGSLKCGQCGKRLCFTRVVKPSDLVFDYFFCVGRQRKTCDLRLIKTGWAEEKIEDYWQDVRLDPEYASIINDVILEELHILYAENELMQSNAKKKRTDIMKQQQKLLEAHYADAIPLSLLKSEQQRLALEHEAIERTIQENTIVITNIEKNLGKALQIIQDFYRAYVSAPPTERRTMNQAVFKEIIVEPEDDIAAVLNEEYAALFTPDILQAPSIATSFSSTEKTFHRDDWLNGVPAWLVKGGWWDKIKQTAFTRGNRPIREILEESGLSLNKFHLVPACRRISNNSYL